MWVALYWTKHHIKSALRRIVCFVTMSRKYLSMFLSLRMQESVLVRNVRFERRLTRPELGLYIASKLFTVLRN